MILSVQQLSKRYGGLEALHPLSFELQPGSILGLIGPNGAGKTTMLRCLCGILRPSSGKITINGNDLATAPVKAKSSLAFVPDDPHLFDSLTVWEHFVFAASAYRVHAFEPMAIKLMEQYKLTEKRDVTAHELSRGMRQKLAICCAELHSPRLLMLDEPLTGLDPLAIRTVQDSMRRRAEDGAAMIISSHLLPLVEDMCSKLLVMHRGRTLFFGEFADARDVLARRLERATGDSTLEDLFLAATADER